MTKQSLEKYTKLSKQKKLTFSEIKMIKKALNGLRLDKPIDDIVFKMQIDNFINSMVYSESKHYKLTKEHSKQGIEFLRKYCFKLNGEIRQSNTTLDEYECNIVKKFSKFEFVGFYELNNGYGMIWYEPVWRTYSKKGNSFDYYCGHWSKPQVI